MNSYNRMANVIFEETSFIAYALRVHEKEKQKIHFTNANTNNEKV